MRSPAVLLVRVGAMGDVLHALPALAALRRARPEAVVGWAVDTRWAPLLVDESGAGPLVSRVHLAETRLWSRRPFSAATLRSVLRLRQRLEAQRYTQVVDLQGTLRSAVIGRMAGSEELAGFADPRELPARLLYRRPFVRRGTHVVEQNAALLGDALSDTLGAHLEPHPPELPVFPVAGRWVGQFLATAGVRSRFALLTPTAGWGAKQWPAAHFGALARVLQAMGFLVLINSGTTHDEVPRTVVEASGGAAITLQSTLPQLVELVRRAALVVGGDTGPVHLAATLGRPLVGLYGPTDPARNGPWGAGPMRVLRHPVSVTSHRKVADTDPGLAQIGVAEVVAAVEDVLGEM